MVPGLTGLLMGINTYQMLRKIFTAYINVIGVMLNK